jgi:site-specific recombinase XerD
MGESHMIERQEDGRWKVDVEPVKGRRFRRMFKTKAEAMRFEAHVRPQQTHNPAGNPAARDRRRLLDLLAIWGTLHGHTLADYAGRELLMRRLFERLGNPEAQSVSPAAFAAYRADRLASGISGKTLNNELTYARAMFNQLRALDCIDYANPLEGIKPLRLQERELTYLDHAQVERLFAVLRSMVHVHVELVAFVCLVTGCRWGEAQSLVPSRVRGGFVQFVNTKSRKRRAVPITLDLEKRLLDHFERFGLFTRCRDTFDDALERAGIELPAGQSTHVLRHTFASHFVMNGGSLLALQKILGHSSLSVTMRYAHLAPDHMQDVLTFGPARDFRHFFDTVGSVSGNDEKKSL